MPQLDDNRLFEPGAVRRTILDLRRTQFNRIRDSSRTPTKEDVLECTWITSGLEGGRAHSCWGCAQTSVAHGVIVPFLLEAQATYGDEIPYTCDDAICFYNYADAKPIFIIERFALFCNTGTSRNMIAQLNVKLYTTDWAETEHTWVAPVPETSLFSRKRGGVVLNQEVHNLLKNDIYPQETRDLLSMLMRRLCIGSGKIQKTALRITRLGKPDMPVH